MAFNKYNTDESESTVQFWQSKLDRDFTYTAYDGMVFAPSHYAKLYSKDAWKIIYERWDLYDSSAINVLNSVSKNKDIIMWLIDTGLYLKIYTKDSDDITIYYKSECVKKSHFKFFKFIVIYEDDDVLLKFMSKHSVLDTKYANFAAQIGNINLLQLLYNHYDILPDKNGIKSNINTANNNLDILEWFKLQGKIKLLDTDIANHAAHNAKLEILYWLQQYDILPNPILIDGMVNPIILEWLQEQGAVLDQNTANRALLYDNLESLQYLQQKFIYPTQKGIEAVICTMNELVLQWLIANDIAPRPDIIKLYHKDLCDTQLQLYYKMGLITD